MSRKNKSENTKIENQPKGFQHENHAKPVTRRDFLAQGLIGMSAFSTLPGILTMLSARQALGAEACADLLSTGSGGMVPFLVFDCAGGAALFANWVPHSDEQQSSTLKSYTTLGLGTNPAGISMDRSMGAALASATPFATGANPSGGSQVLRGILNTTTADARANFRMGIICHTGLSDSNDNTNSAIQLISAAGLQGSLLKIGLGVNSTTSGTNGKVPVDNPTLRPLRVGSFTDFSGALGYGATLQTLPKGALDALAKALSRLSESQTAELARMNLGAQFATLAQCGLIKNKDYTAAPAGIDPRADSTFQTVYGINAGTGANAGAVVSATIVMNALKGNSGPGGITIGGCDYHDGTQTSGDAKDLELGTQIGRAVQAAHLLGKPLMFQVLTDGGISSSGNTRNWSGDSNERSLTVVGFYNPSGPVAMRKSQVGFYTPGEGASTSTLVGSSLNSVAASVLANYLTMNNKMSLLSKLMPPNSLPPSQIDQVIHLG